MGWIISPYTAKQAALDLQQKETGSRTVATSKYASCGAFLSVQCACQIPIVLHHYLQRFSLLCVLTSILSHLTTSSVPNLHNAKILNTCISGTRGDMTKRKMPFFFTFKGLSNKPFFNSSIFHFIGTLRQERLILRSILARASGTGRLIHFQATYPMQQNSWHQWSYRSQAFRQEWLSLPSSS